MRPLLLAAALSFLAGASRADEVLVVMPEEPSSAYVDALQGICDALSSCPRVLTDEGENEIPADTRVVIALGGRAARLSYPARAVLVTALSPGYDARPRRGAGPVVRVRMTLSPDEFVRRLLALSPGARSAALLWSEPASGRFAFEVRAAGVPYGVAVVPIKVFDTAALPALLRGLPRTDALWLAPDSALVTPTTFRTAREYARNAGETFFAPAPALAAQDAVAGLAPDFRSSGLRAGAAAREALAGIPVDEDAYPSPALPEPLMDIIASTRTIGP